MSLFLYGGGQVVWSDFELVPFFQNTLQSGIFLLVQLKKTASLATRAAKFSVSKFIFFDIAKTFLLLQRTIAK